MNARTGSEFLRSSSGKILPDVPVQDGNGSERRAGDGRHRRGRLVPPLALRSAVFVDAVTDGCTALDNIALRVGSDLNKPSPSGREVRAARGRSGNTTGRQHALHDLLLGRQSPFPDRLTRLLPSEAFTVSGNWSCSVGGLSDEGFGRRCGVGFECAIVIFFSSGESWPSAEE